MFLRVYYGLPAANSSRVVQSSPCHLCVYMCAHAWVMCVRVQIWDCVWVCVQVCVMVRIRFACPLSDERHPTCPHTSQYPYLRTRAVVCNFNHNFATVHVAVRPRCRGFRVGLSCVCRLQCCRYCGSLLIRRGWPRVMFLGHIRRCWRPGLASLQLSSVCITGLECCFDALKHPGCGEN